MENTASKFFESRAVKSVVFLGAILVAVNAILNIIKFIFSLEIEPILKYSFSIFFLFLVAFGLLLLQYHLLNNENKELKNENTVLLKKIESLEKK